MDTELDNSFYNFYLDDANMPLLTAPNVEHATNTGIIHRISPNILFPNVTATALDERISVEERTAK